PGPSSVWLDAWGRRFPAPNFPGFDTLGTLEVIQKTGYDYSWFILTEKIIEKEFALSASEQNPDLTGQSIRKVLGRVRSGAPGPVRKLVDYGEDRVVAGNIDNLGAGMSRSRGEKLLDARRGERPLQARDRERATAVTKDHPIP